jgi:sRNA-binding regulator protein Hfq
MKEAKLLRQKAEQVSVFLSHGVNVLAIIKDFTAGRFHNVCNHPH